MDSESLPLFVSSMGSNNKLKSVDISGQWMSMPVYFKCKLYKCQLRRLTVSEQDYNIAVILGNKLARLCVSLPNKINNVKISGC